MKKHYIKLLRTFAATNKVAFLREFAKRYPHNILPELFPSWHVVKHYAEVNELSESLIQKRPDVFENVFISIEKIDSKYLQALMVYFSPIVDNVKQEVDLNLAKEGDIITIDDKDYVIKAISKIKYKKEFLIFIEGEFQLHRAQDGSVITPSDFGAISCLKIN